MNNGFKVAQSVARMGPETLTHTQKVQRLYRHGLKTLGSWAIDRNVFLNEADVMRAAFESNRASGRGASLLAQGEEKLFDFTHSDPYCQPYMPGGSKFMRNPPPPTEVCQSFLKNRCAAEESGEEGAPSVGDGLG